MIAVVGAGIAGLAIAHELALHGISVALFDRGDIPGKGASSVPVAVLNVHRGRKALAHPEDMAGLEAMRALLADLGLTTEKDVAALTGVVRVANTEERASRWRSLAGAVPLDERECAREFGREVLAPHGGVLFANGGFVATDALREALLRALLGNAEFHPNTPVLSYATHERGVILKTQRETFRVAAAVFCTGSDPNPWDARHESRLVAGEQIAFASARTRAHSRPLLGTCYAVWLPGLTWIGGNHRREGSSAVDGVSELTREATRLLPELASLPVHSTFTGWRRALPDNRPRIETEGKQVLHVFGLSGRGYLMAALLAKHVHAHFSRGFQGKRPS